MGAEMKPADELREANPYQCAACNRFDSAQKAAALLDECERLAADLIEWDNREGRDPWEPLIKNARATLAKLRGEA